MADNRERNGYENLQHMRKQKEIDTKVESGMKNFVITIGREFGSGGHNLAIFFFEKIETTSFE